MTVEATGITDGLSEGSVKTSPPLGVANYVNLASYVLGLAFIGLSLAGIVGPTNPELSAKYQTLISPNSGAFVIWPVIYALGLVAVIVQMTPKYRGSKLVATIAPWWASSAICQSVWTILFAQELILASAVAIIAIAVSLYGLIISADNVTPTDAVEFWTVRAGFSVYAGWLTAASLVNANVGFDYLKYGPETMLALAVFSLAALLAITTLVAVYLPKPDAGIPLVAAWASYWITVQLNIEITGEGFLSSPIRHNPYDWRGDGGIVLKGFAQAFTVAMWSALVLSAVAVVIRWQRSSETTADLPK